MWPGPINHFIMSSSHHFFNDISNIFILLRSIPGKKTCISVLQIKPLASEELRNIVRVAKPQEVPECPSGLYDSESYILFPHGLFENEEVVRAYLSVNQFSSVVSDSLWPHELQHARPPCPSPPPGVYSNSCPSSRRCHPTISSSVIPFSSCPQFLPASGSFPMSQLFAYCHVNWCS